MSKAHREKTHANFDICPVCGNTMKYVDILMQFILDGNTIYQCTKHKTHRFWTHPFSRDTIHLNPNVKDVTDWHSDKDFRWNGEHWEHYYDPDNLEHAIFGSIDSNDLDVMYFLDELPPLQMCKELAGELKIHYTRYYKSVKPVDVNICVVKNNQVVDTYKGTIDEVNNMIHYTTCRHKQQSKFPTVEPVTRNVPLKVARVLRGILSFISRTEYRSAIKQALNGDAKLKLDTLEAIPLRNIKSLGTKNNNMKDFYKMFAFQIGQTNGLMNGAEYYSKSSIAAHYPELKQYLYRDANEFTAIDEIKQLFIDKVRDKINMNEIKE